VCCRDGSFSANGKAKGSVAVLSSTCHKRDREVLVPWRMLVPLYMTSRVVLVRYTVHPASQSWPSDIRDFVRRAGTTYTWRALIGKVAGRLGRYMSAIVSECIVEPFGFWMLMGLRAGRALWYGAPIVKKCAVQPVSAMARWPLGAIGMGMGIGGPGVGTGNRFVGTDKSGESHKIDILMLSWTGS
jgi:hypothetical protein